MTVEAAPAPSDPVGPAITSRTYVHDTCKEATTISGREFQLLCDPDAHIAGTICAACDAPDAFGKFAWADTGENLQAYRRRLRKRMSAGWMVMRAVVAPLVALVLVFGIPLASQALDVPGKVAVIATIVCAAAAFFGIRMWAASKWRPDWRRYR